MRTEVAPHLSVVIPFRDEAASLATLVGELMPVLDALPFESEVIFVDDASRDEGCSVLGALAARDTRIRLLSLSPHSGQSAALAAGFDVAEGEIVATLDADLQNAPEDLPRLIDGLARADCVCGVRVERRDSLAKRAASRVANAARRRVLGDFVTDVGCSLRVMRAADLARIRLFHGGHRFLPSLLAMQGVRVIEMPVSHRARRYGVSKYDIRRRLGAVWIDLLGVYWMKRRVDRYEVKELNRRA